MIRNFYFPQLAKTEIIEEFDGRIIIGEGENIFVLEGIALPRVDMQGFVIDGEYVLGEFDLFQSGTDLVISKTGTDLSKENAAQIIIKNFPFYSGGFGFFLNRFPSGELLPAKEFEDLELFSQTVFASRDVRQRFFAPAKIPAADGTINYAIKSFDSRGLNLGTQLLTNFSSVKNGADSDFPASVTGYVIENDLIASRLENGHVALIYEVREETYGVKNSLLFCASLAFLAVVNENGIIISNQPISEIASNDEKNFTTLDPAAIGSTKSGKNFACFSKSNGSGFICQEFDLNGQLVGEDFETDSIDEYKNSNSFGSALAGLSQGYKIEADIPNGFKIFTPFYKNSANKNLAKNYYLHEPQVTLPNDKKAMISFCEEIETLAKVTRNPNSTLVISGLDLSIYSQIDLRDFELSLEEVLENSFAASPSQYTVADLLDHKFSAENSSEVVPPESNLLFNTARDIAVLELPENQQLIFLNFSLKNFREFAAEMLVLSEDDLQEKQQLDQ
jgi:hypothetical protein